MPAGDKRNRDFGPRYQHGGPGGAGGFNPIGHVQPHREDSTRSEEVESSRSGVRLAATSIFVNAEAEKPLAMPTAGGRAKPDKNRT